MVIGFHTPILFNVFNRPSETTRVLEKLRQLEPPCLYVHGDGPREGNRQDSVKVQAVRKIVKESITWPCDLHFLFENKNLGCGRGPATSLDWFFSNVEQGIVLEDDCCPNLDFFMYCQELLEKYKDDTRIGVISGTCFSSNSKLKHSYRFSAYAGIWGWATWKRTWDLFDYEFVLSDDEFDKRVSSFIHSKGALNYWKDILHLCIKDGNDRSYWDYQLHLAMLCANLIHIVPNRNLVSNIGFNEEASHTSDANSVYANKPTMSILPLNHPTKVSINHRIDNRPYELSNIKRLKKFFKKILLYGRV